jgi:3,4-dihydroxy 2-butanone 4-phosphate synthase/GTP cyclohydrolase II
MAAIAAAGAGVVIYLRNHEGRGIGLLNKIKAYSLQEAGLDTVDANLRLGLPVDARDYAPAAAILNELGISDIRLLTNNPGKVEALTANGVHVRDVIPLQSPPRPESRLYLEAKRNRLGHRLALPSAGVHILSRRDDKTCAEATRAG